MFNKRGQEGITIGTLLLIVLGLVVVVTIIIGATSGFGFIFDKFKLAPGQDLQAVAKSCEIAAQNNLKADYCYTFKEVELDGKSQYVNCEDSRVIASMVEQVDKSFTCDDVDEKSAIENYCMNNVAEKDWEKILVNGKTCKDYGYMLS